MTMVAPLPIHRKGLFEGESFKAGGSVLNRPGDSGIAEKSMMSRALLEWTTRLERCIESNGAYETVRRTP
jgi:hypothetical protein